MVTPQVLDYVRQQLVAGHARAEIERALISSGWSQADVEQAFVQVAPKPTTILGTPTAPASVKAAGSQPMTQVESAPAQALSRWWLWVLLVVLLLLLVVAAIAAYFFTPVGMMVKSYFAPVPADAPLVATTTPPVTEQTYANARFGYSLSYPSTWTVEPETQVIDEVNKMLSIVFIRDASQTHKVAIIVNEKEWPLKSEAPYTASTTIAGIPQTAYLFPDGYECLMADPNATDCSFFVIPIKHNDLWYELRAQGNAKTVTDTYRKIFDTFAFATSTP